MSTSATGTSGSCTATLQGDADFTTFAAADLKFYPNESFNKWTIIASAPNADKTQLITLNIPKEGDVTNKQYAIGTQQDGDASAFWVKSIFGTWHNHQALTGTLTVTVDEARQMLSATFNFSAVNGSKTVQVTQGNLNVQGYYDGTQTLDSGSVTAAISGDVNLNFQSTQVALTHELTPNFPPSVFGWAQHHEDRPFAATYILSIHIADSLIPGTYNITDDSQQVRLFFYDMNSRFVSYRGVSGTLTVQSLPTPGTVNGVLRGTFNFTGATSDSAATITGSNGQFTIQK